MARARNIKPGFFTNDTLAEINPLGRLLFIALWTMADREGRLEDRPKKIKAEALPYDNANIERLLADLQKHGFILRYTVDGSAYIQVLNFCKHQNPHQREPASTIPAPGKSGTGTGQAPGLSDESTGPAGSNPLPDPPSLIPDSGFPHPPTGDPMPGQGEHPSPAVLLAIEARRHGVQCQSADPRLIALADAGVTVETVGAACDHAKQSKPGERVGIGLVAAIVTRWEKQAAGVNGSAGTAPPARASPRRSAAVEAGIALSGLSRTTQPETIDVVATPAVARLVG